MHEPRSIVIRPLTMDELHAARLLARTDRSFAATTLEAARLRFLSERMRGRLDPEASLGLDLLEAGVLTRLARMPLFDDRAVRQKASLFRCRCAAAADDNLAAMLEAALRADEARLAVGHGRGQRPARDRS